MNTVLQMPNPVQPSATVAIVDPITAERWLSTNTNNRPVSRDEVDRFARDMAAGRWQLTGEAIKFDINGNILDGQHRLLAILKSGATIQTLVVFNLSSTAQTVMDTGRKRTAANALHFLGYKHNVKVASAARIGMSYEDGQLRDLPSTLIGRSNAEVVAYVERNPGLLVAAEAPIYAAPTPSAGVLCFAYFHLHKINGPACEAFFGDLASMRLGGSGDPRTTLVKRWTSARANREQISQSEQLHIIFRAWNAVRADEELKLIRIHNSTRLAVPQ